MEQETDITAPTPKSWRDRFPRLRWILLALLGVALIFWLVPVIVEALTEGDGLPEIDLSKISYPYLLIGGFVAFDAVIPILPSESLLTAASTLAAQEGSQLELWKIIVAGALGATFGDSMLYWLSRTLIRRFAAGKLEQVKQDERVAIAFEVMGESAPLLIVAGRFVPGMRYAVNASMGLARYPYPRFLFFSTIGGFVWSTYTCVISFQIGTALSDYPLISILTSVALTGVVVLIMFFVMKRRWERAKESREATEALA